MIPDFCFSHLVCFCSKPSLGSDWFEKVGSRYDEFICGFRKRLWKKIYQDIGTIFEQERWIWFKMVLDCLGLFFFPFTYKFMNFPIFSLLNSWRKDELACCPQWSLLFSVVHFALSHLNRLLIDVARSEPCWDQFGFSPSISPQQWGLYSLATRASLQGSSESVCTTLHLKKGWPATFSCSVALFDPSPLSCLFHSCFLINTCMNKLELHKVDYL